MRLNVFKLCAATVICTVIISCNSSKKTIAAKETIDGTWVVKNIAIEGLGGKVEAMAFNEASYNCFNGSIWKFDEIKKTGEFTLNGGASADCPVINRQINWKINSSDILNKKIEFTKIVDGSSYILNIINISSENMQLKYEVANITFMGKPVAIIYTFTKA